MPEEMDKGQDMGKDTGTVPVSPLVVSVIESPENDTPLVIVSEPADEQDTSDAEKDTGTVPMSPLVASVDESPETDTPLAVSTESAEETEGEQ